MIAAGTGGVRELLLAGGVLYVLADDLTAAQHDQRKIGSGELIWKREFKARGEIMPTTVAVDDGRVCLQTVSHVVCLDAFGGKELWRSRRPVATSRFSWSTPTLVVHDGVVLTSDRKANDNVGKSPPVRGSEWIISGGGFEDRQDSELVAFSFDDGEELYDNTVDPYEIIGEHVTHQAEARLLRRRRPEHDRQDLPAPIRKDSELPRYPFPGLPGPVGRG